MQLRCLTCGTEFGIDGAKGGPRRCPRCLRTHGLEELSPPGLSRPACAALRARRLATPGRVAVAASALVAMAGGALLWSRVRPRPAPNAPGAARVADVAAALRAAGIPAAKTVIAFAGNGAVDAFARAAAPGGADARARAAALADAIARKIASAGTPRPPGTRRPPLPRTAPVLLAALSAGRAGAVGSYEAAALALACARAAGLRAVPAEMWRKVVAAPSADPGGAEGRFVVLVYESEAAEAPVAAAIDPLSGGADDVNARTPLSDVVFAGRFYGERALAEIAAGQDDAALRDVAWAGLVCPRAADVAASDGVVRGALGDRVGALEAWRRAVSLRDDPPHRAGLGEALLRAGTVDAAKRALDSALQEEAKLPFAHLALARLALARGDAVQAKGELAAAAKAAPDLPEVALTQAGLLAATGDTPGAEKALRALAHLDGPPPASPDEEEAACGLYALLATRSQGDEANEVAAALERRSAHPAVIRARLRELAPRAPDPGAPPASAPSWLAAGTAPPPPVPPPATAPSK